MSISLVKFEKELLGYSSKPNVKVHSKCFYELKKIIAQNTIPIFILYYSPNESVSA